MGFNSAFKWLIFVRFYADPSGCAILGVDLWLLVCWDLVLESRRRRECLLWVLCAVRWRYLRRTDHSSRGILSSVCVSLSV